MENNRLLFRAVVEADYYDNDGNDKTVKLLLNNVAVYTPVTVGVTDEILVNAIRNTNLNAKERNSVYSYFEANNECSDSEWFVLEAETIEQCTGIKDANGKLIFEGDIINDPTWWWGPCYVYLSIGQCDPCRADNVGEYILSKNMSNPLQDAIYNEWNGDEVTVIGNIHENPELLETRFRAWDKSFQKYCENVIVSTINGEITVYERLVNGNTALIPPTHVVLEQCTGLRDKNGRLIYEGDIVRRHSKYSEDEKDVVLQVEWNRKGARYITTDKKHDSWIFSMFDYEYEILGNIHENPEMLEGK